MNSAFIVKIMHVGQNMWPTLMNLLWANFVGCANNSLARGIVASHVRFQSFPSLCGMLTRSLVQNFLVVLIPSFFKVASDATNTECGFLASCLYSLYFSSMCPKVLTTHVLSQWPWERIQLPPSTTLASPNHQSVGRLPHLTT